ncbi:hypothetical protein [Methanobrevibacter sp.]|uniref:hypothetical protein n=1 Tax=Methanobrevibacter sp. TaxID=66852 RepID=UPI0038647336
MIIIVVFAVTGVVSAAENVTDDAVSVEEMTVGLNFEKDTNYICNDTNVISYKSNDDMADKLNYAFNDGSFKDLSDDIANANGELNLSRNYVFDSSDSANAIIVEKPIIINGNGHNILAESKTSVFSITASNVILKNINFYDSSGGSINWQGSNGTLINCKFEDCKNTGNGGAIYWKNDKNGLISNCTFKRCTSTNEGGALYLDDTHIKIENCDFIDNAGSTSSGNGCGAIYVDGGKINIDNCTFNHNVAGSGGAIRGGNSAGSIINNSKFINNTNLAILWNGNNFEIDNSIFIDNSNQVSKGFGPYAPINSAGTLNAYGGAVRIFGDYTKISNSVFNKNKISATIRSNVDRYKDPIFNQWNYYNIRETFHINTYGGAISVNGNKFYINNISCTDNLAYSSGYVNVQYQSSTYSLVDMNMEQYIYANSYGGAIYLNGGGILSNAFISGNKLDGYANVNKGIVPAQNCKIICEVKGYGVGVYWDGYSRNNLVNNSVFIQNNLSSGQTGSALYLNNFKGDVNYNIFLQNPEKGIDSSASEFSADYNWWGNTASNFNQKLCSDDLGISKWLFLNMSSNNSKLEIGDVATVTLDLTNVYDSSSNNIEHAYEINNVDFNLITNKLKTNVSNAVITNGVAHVEIIATIEGQGSLTAEYNGVRSTLTFKISKKTSQINTQINNCSIYNDKLIAYVNVTPNATGTLNIYLNNDFYSSIGLTNGNGTYKIDLTGLNVNNYTLYVVYNGDSNYSGSSDTIEFEIKKATNNIQISDPYTVDYGDVITLDVNKGNVTDGTLFIQVKNNKNSIYNCTYNIMNINNISLPVLDAGDYNLFIIYESNNYYGSDFDFTFTVNKLNPITNKQIINTVYGKSEMMFNSSVEGILTINIQNKTYKTFNIKSNQDTSVNLSDVDAGDYEIKFVFVPINKNYNNVTSKTTLTIFKSEPTFDIVINDIEYKESASLDIHYLNDVTGFANITISNDEGFEIKYSNVALSGNNINKVLSNLNASKYTISLEYGGNDNYYPVNISKSFNVLKIDPIIVVDVINSVYGQSAKITVNCNAEGNITINIGLVKTYDGLSIRDNRVVQSINDVDAGVYDVKVIYGGNNNYNAKTENTKLTIVKASSNVVATVDDVTYSQQSIINVKGSIDGIAVVSIDDNYIKNADVIANTVVPVTFENIPAGKHNVSVQLKPSNKNFEESTYNTEFTVSKKDTTVDLDVANSVYGDDVIVNVTASEDGKIIVKIGDITKEKTVFANAVTKINFGVLAVNSYDVIVSFDAGDNYKLSSGEGKIIVSPAEAKITDIQANNNIYGENTAIAVKTNVGGILTVKINNIVKTFNIDANKLTSFDLGKYDVNNYNIDLTLDAGANYTQATGNTKVTITPKQTAVSLDTNDEVYGNNVVVKVTASEKGKVTVQIGNIVKSVNVDANKVTSVDFGILDVNSYEVIATFDGGKNFNTSSDKDSFEISPKASSVTFINLVNNYIYSNNVVVNVKSDVAGTVTVKVGDKTQTKQITAGNVVSFDFGILDVNKYDVLVSLNAGSNYISSQNTASITISPKSTVVTLNTRDYNADEKVIVNVTASENGKATIKLGNVIKNVDVIANKIASVDFGVLSTGSYDVVATFAAGNNYIDSSDSANIKVLTKIDEKDINITVPEIKPNQENNIVINLPADATGTVTLIIGDNAYTFNVKNGIANINMPKLDEGNYKYVINYSGDSKYSSFENTGSIDVAKPDPEIVIPPLDKPSEDGSVAIKLPSDATGTVTLVINGKAYSFPVINGVANVYMPELNAGNYNYSITYSGDGKYSPFTNVGSMNVAKKPVTITALSVSTVYNGGKYIVATLKDGLGNPISGLTVSINVNGKTSTLTTYDNGQVKLTVNGLAPKSYTATVKFGGNAKYYASTKSVKVTVKKATLKLTAKAKTFKKSVKTKKYTVTLKTNSNKVMKNTKLTLKVNGKTYSATTNAKGQATFKITKLTKKGKFTGTIAYKGNAYYNKLSKKVKITIK